jgi:catechol 2,3-dioxygenase-like lactoylglutathione lyase family enzyme
VFDHVTIRVTDRERAERFYGEVLDAAGIAAPTQGSEATEWQDFSIAAAGPEQPPTRRLHLAFAVASRAHVDAFWEAGRAAGHPDAGAPGPRPQYTPSYYGAFLLDPDGNSAEAVHHDGTRADGNLDHLWIRVADLPAARRFYATVAPHAGLQVGTDTRERVSFVPAVPGGGTFSLVPGPPTEHLHMAFPATEDRTVQAFHATALAAGYRDNGGPGERPRYHPGYYGAFVLDPDGNNIEVVNHHR